ERTRPGPSPEGRIGGQLLQAVRRWMVRPATRSRGLRGASKRGPIYVGVRGGVGKGLRRGTKSSVTLLFARFRPGKGAASEIGVLPRVAGRLTIKIWKPGGTRCPLDHPGATPGA